MNTTRLFEILNETTVQFRKGAIYEGSPDLVEQAKSGEELTAGGVLEINAMPHESQAPENLEKVDVEFIVIGVNKAAAEQHRDALTEILGAFPDPVRLARGPSYIEVGAVIGDQGAAFQLFALGKTLGLWELITPASMGFRGDEARQMAGMGFVMISGFKEVS